MLNTFLQKTSGQLPLTFKSWVHGDALTKGSEAETFCGKWESWNNFFNRQMVYN